MPEEFETIIIYNRGDPSVGIKGDEAKVILRVDGFEGEDRRDFLRDAKTHLAKAFTEIWEFPAFAKTLKEIEAENKQIMAALTPNKRPHTSFKP